MYDSIKARTLLTYKHGRDRLRGLQNNIKKGTTKMRNKINNIHINLSKYSAYLQVCLFCRTLLRVGQMIVPALTGAYLVWIYDDKIVIGIGVALALYSLLKVVNSAYLAESRPAVKTSKRK